MKRTYQRVAVIAFLIVGIFLRFYHLFKIDFQHEPFRLGGLFLAFADQIIKNEFRLPKTIPFYSEGGIPFAYPPFGFYVEAIFLNLFPNHRILIANLLPPVVSALALIGAFLFLRWYYHEQGSHILAGTFAYAFLPLAFTNQIEAAGLAESFGSLALVIFFYCVARFRNLPNWKNAALAGGALGICVLSSPGSAIGASFLSCLVGLETLLKNRFNMPAIGQVCIVAVTGMIVAMPYWAAVMSYHGRGLFLYPILAQYDGVQEQSFFQVFVQTLMNFSVVQDGSAFFWSLAIFLGWLWQISRGQFVLPITFLALLGVPREGIWLTALPASMLFAHGFVDVLLGSMRPASETTKGAKSSAFVSLVVLIGFVMAFQSFAVSEALIADQQWKITPEQIEMVEGSRSLIPEDAKVLVIGNDALLEWSPYLLQHEVINTKFGLEWKPGLSQSVALLNRRISDAQTWDEVLQAVIKFNGSQRVYVLSSEKKLLTKLNLNSSVPFNLKIETPAIQLGILGKP